MSSFVIKEIAEVQAGPFGTQLHKTDYVSCGVPMLNAKNIGAGVVITDSMDFVSETVCRKLPQYLLEFGDIVFGRSGTIDKHTCIDKEYESAFQGTNCIRVRLHDRRLATYISYYLNLDAVKQRISLSAGKTTQQYLTTDNLEQIVVDIPGEQIAQNICSLLSMLDRKIEINNTINAEHEKLARTIYEYWFVQFDFPDANGKPYKSSGGAMEYNEILKREIPVGWKADKLTKTRLCSLISSGVDAFEGEKIYLSTSEVDGAEIVNHTIKTDYLNRTARANMQPTMNSVWFAKMKNTRKNILINDSAKALVEKYIFSTGLSGLQCTKETLYYLWCYLRGDYFETKKDKVASGATQQAINETDLSGFDIITPKQNVLESFCDMVTPYYELVNKHKVENIELAALRDFLLPLLMNGQVTIGEAQENIATTTPFKAAATDDSKFQAWKQQTGIAARGDIDERTLRNIYEAMDADDR